MLIAIDHGNYAIKTPHTSFVAGLAEYTSKPPMADEVIEYKGKFWTLTNSRLPYMRDKTGDEHYFILTLFAIAKELTLLKGADSFMNVELAVGLPPEHFSLLKKKFADYFLRREIIMFEYNGRNFSILIQNVLVYPQAYSAAVTRAKQMLKTSRTFIVDIGGYTTDVLLLLNGSPDLSYCRSLETGVITMNNEIIRKVGSLHNIMLTDEHISDVLQGKSTIFSEEVKAIIRENARQHAKYILDKLRELHVDLRSDPAVFIGGGSILFREYIESSELVASAAFIEDPKANAQGYLLLGEQQLRSKKS